MKNIIITLLCAITMATGCRKPDYIQNTPEDKFAHAVGETLWNHGLEEYRGPDTDWKTITPKDYPALQDDHIRFTARQESSGIIPGGPIIVNKYSGTIYQGNMRFWEGKPQDITFDVTYINDSTFRLGNEVSYNIAKFRTNPRNHQETEMEIYEEFPVKGRYYKFGRISD